MSPFSRRWPRPKLLSPCLVYVFVLQLSHWTPPSQFRSGLAFPGSNIRQNIFDSRNRDKISITHAGFEKRSFTRAVGYQQAQVNTQRYCCVCSFLNATPSLSPGQACMVILTKSALNIAEDCTSSSGQLSYWLGSRSVIRTRFEVGPMSAFYITSASDMTFSRIQILPLFPRWRSVALSCARWRIEEGSCREINLLDAVPFQTLIMLNYIGNFGVVGLRVLWCNHPSHSLSFLEPRTHQTSPAAYG